MKLYRKAKFICILILIFLPWFAFPHEQAKGEQYARDKPEIPRITAKEAYAIYKQGKALLLYAGGEKYARRHVLGDFNLDVKNREAVLAKFPKKGFEYIIYCH